MIRHTPLITFVLGFLACDGGGGGGGGEGAATYAAACERFGATYARCFTAACPNAAPFEALFAAEQVNGCLIVEDNPTQNAFYRQWADGACDDVYFSAATAQDVGQAGNRQAFCTQGPIVDPPTCTERCTTVTACLTDANPFSLIYGQQAPCEAACIARPDSAATIECLAATGCAESDCSED